MLSHAPWPFAVSHGLPYPTAAWRMPLSVQTRRGLLPSPDKSMFLQLPMQAQCATCHTHTTPLWRPIAGVLYCNACGVRRKRAAGDHAAPAASNGGHGGSGGGTPSPRRRRLLDQQPDTNGGRRSAERSGGGGVGSPGHGSLGPPQGFSGRRRGAPPLGAAWPSNRAAAAGTPDSPVAASRLLGGAAAPRKAAAVAPRDQLAALAAAAERISSAVSPGAE